MIRKLTGWFFEGGDPVSWSSVGITAVAVVVPPAAAVMIYGRMGAIAFIASLPAHLAAKDEGILPATLVTLTLVMAGLLSLGSTELSLIVAPVLGIMTGICGRYGHARICLRALITWTVFTSPILPEDQKPQLFAIFILAMVWGLAITKLFGETNTGDEEDRESEEYALVFGLILAIGLTLAVYIGDRYFGEHGFWFPLTFVVLCLPPHGKLFSRTIKRTLGTALGTAIAIGGAWISDDTWVLVALGLLTLLLAFRCQPWNYTLFTTFLTISVLEVLALVSDVGTLAVERINTMVAAAAMTAVLGGIGVLVLWMLRPEALKALQDD